MLGVGLGLTSRAGPQGGAAGPGPDGPLVFALLGQSNMIGRAAFDGGSVHPAGVQQWGRAAPNDNTLIPAVHPLDHVDPSPGHMGLDISFAEAVLAARPEASLVFVPGAEGGTGFQSDHWRPGGNCYVDAVTRIDAALAALPGASLAGILWHQGESDAGNPVFQADLDGLITGLRQDITAAGSATPFILGGLVPGWVAADPARQPIQAVLEDTPARHAHTGFAATDDLTGAGSNVHFTAADLRTLGARYAAAWLAAATPMASGQIPDQVDVTGTLAAPGPADPVPDQTDPQGPAVPQALDPIPDQEDTLP